MPDQPLDVHVVSHTHWDREWYHPVGRFRQRLVELIASGEALVRNLLTGRRVLRALRATSPPVLYCPDSFGHPAALPELALGFGFSTVILWRGLGGRRWPPGDTFQWAAPSGATAVVFHLPSGGYDIASNLPAARPQAAERWRELRSAIAPRSRLGVLLVHNGGDHH